MDHPFPIYGNYKGKEYTAQVLSTGFIVLDEKSYTSPTAAGQAVMGSYKGKPLQVDGWKFWKFNKDGERVELNILRGKESPLKTLKAKKAAA